MSRGVLRDNSMHGMERFSFSLGFFLDTSDQHFNADLQVWKGLCMRLWWRVRRVMHRQLLFLRRTSLSTECHLLRIVLAEHDWADLAHCAKVWHLSFFLSPAGRTAAGGLEGVSARSRGWCGRQIFVCCNPVCLQTPCKSFPWTQRESNRRWFLWWWLQASLSPTGAERSCVVLFSLQHGVISPSPIVPPLLALGSS